MSIGYKILGIPGQDNSLFARVDSGKHIYQLLFDAGESCLFHLGRAILQELDHLFLSHCHMDHICGFDGVFRYLYTRKRPFHIWGPEGLIHLMHCRLQGFTWNLVQKSPGETIVHEIGQKTIKTAGFLCKEGFSVLHDKGERNYDKIIYKNDDYFVTTELLDHQLVCLGYSVEETEKENISAEKMKQQKLKPGKWCREIKTADSNKEIEIETQEGYQVFSAKYLRENLIEKRKGMKISYVTDVIFHDENAVKIRSLVADADILVIESSYLDSEYDLAKKNFHLTVSEATTLGHEARVKKIILFHVSDRYRKDELARLLEKAKTIWADTSFPDHWIIEKG